MRITVQLQLRQYDFPLKMLPMFLDAYWWGIQVPHAIAPAHYLLPHSSNSVIAQSDRNAVAAHVKSNSLYSRSFGRNSKFFRLNGLLLFHIFMGLRFASYKNSLVGVEVP